MTICIAGHAGVGHVFSHSGFVQDDSQGFALVSSMLCSIKGLSPKITEIEVDRDSHSFTVHTSGGGIGQAFPARGVTPFEVDLVRSIVGENPCFPQRCVMKAFGRLYGHGISEVPVSLEYAIAESLMKSFEKQIEDFRVMSRNTEEADDIVGGISVDMGYGPVVLMLTINGSRLGTGPVEDLEGNVDLDFKKDLMESLGILEAPTIIVESKAYVPTLEGIEDDTFLVRYNKEIDNSMVGQALEQALKDTRTTFKVINSAFPASKGSMRVNTEKFAKELTKVVKDFGEARTAVEKTRLAANISRLVSQDLGGVIFMSDNVHDRYRSAGMKPGTSATLSIVVSQDYLKRNIIPFSTDGNIRVMMKVVNRACEILSKGDFDKG